MRLHTSIIGSLLSIILPYVQKYLLCSTSWPNYITMTISQKYICYLLGIKQKLLEMLWGNANKSMWFLISMCIHVESIRSTLEKLFYSWSKHTLEKNPVIQQFFFYCLLKLFWQKKYSLDIMGLVWIMSNFN